METLKQLLCWIAQVLYIYKVFGECTCVFENRKGACYASKKHHPVLPRFPDWLTVWLRLYFLFYSEHTHTHTTGSQVFSGSAPPQPLPYPSVSLSARVREADWQGCGVCQWCDVFEHCLPLGDETLRWGSVFVWEKKRQREAFAPREYSVRMLQKNIQIHGGHSSSATGGGFTTRAVLVSWCHGGIPPCAIKQHLSCKQHIPPKAPRFDLV